MAYFHKAALLTHLHHFAHYTATHQSDNYLSISCDISVIMHRPGLQPYEIPIHSEIHYCSKECLFFYLLSITNIKTVRQPLNCVATRETIWSFGLLWKSYSQSTLCLTLESLPVLYYGCSFK